MKITEVTINGREDASGINKIPEIAWEMTADERNVRQLSCRVSIFKENECVYDSGMKRRSDSAHFFPRGFHMESLTEYTVTVDVQAAAEGAASEETGTAEDTGDAGAETLDINGKKAGEKIFISASGRPGHFTTALVGEELPGEFISAETKADAGNSKTTYMRRKFRISRPVKKAYLCATALGLYEAHVNGKKAGEDILTPGWTSYLKHLLYQTYDVTGLLRRGENCLGAVLGAGWYKGAMGFEWKRNNYGKQTAFLAALFIEYEDGSRERVLTDPSWKGCDAPVIFAEIYDGEIIDAAKEQKGWDRPGFDDGSWRRTERVAFDKTVISPQDGTAVREMEELKPVRLFTTPSGDTVLDFGQNMSGWLHVHARGKKGDSIDLRLFEVLDAEGNVYLDNLRKAKQEIRYTFGKNGTMDYHPTFTWMGFRYVWIRSFPGKPKAEDFTVRAVYSAMTQAGTFRCSDKNVSRLVQNIRWSMKSNFVDIPTDCPQRDERLGWTGDAEVFSRTACCLMDTRTFYRKWLCDLALDQTPEGGIPHVIPDILNHGMEENWLLKNGEHSAAGWADAAVIIPWNMYEVYGDREILKAQYESMKKWIGFMLAHSKDYIWDYRQQFGDWVALDAKPGSYFGATPNELSCTAFFAYSTGLTAKISRVLHNREDAAFYDGLYEKIVRKYQRSFFKKDGTLKVKTQTACALSLAFGLVPKALRNRTAALLVKLIEKENGHLTTGFLGTPFICRALSENGHTEEACALLLKDDFPSWLYEVKNGATTIWEHWDGLKPDGTMWSPDMNSFNHYAYGAVGEWLFRECAGLDADEHEPGFRKIMVRPHIGSGLSFAEALYHSSYGDIRTGWKMKKDGAVICVTVPCNTKAEVRIPEGWVKEDGTRSRILLGSGTYEIPVRKK